MKILALDTATEACSAVLCMDGQFCERYEVLGRGHAERLLPMVQEVLAEGGVALSALDAIAFGRGPGGFTGLRIAAGVTQGLAFGAGLPVVPVSDLAALAVRAAALHSARHVLACLDARMAQVYCAPFDCADPTAPVALAAESVADPESVRLPDGAERWFGAGHGFAGYPALRTLLGPRLIGCDPQLLPHAHEIALLGAAAFAAGHALPAEQALPVYLRDQVAHKRVVPG